MPPPLPADPADSAWAGEALQRLANTEVEQALLGALLINNRAHEHVADLVQPEDFANGVHGRVYRAIGECITAGIEANPITLRHHFERDGALEQVGGAAYLATLAAAAVTTVNAPHYAQVVAELARRRDVIFAAHDAAGDALDLSEVGRTAADVVDATEQRLYEISAKTTQSHAESVGEVAAAAIRDTELAFKAGGIRTIDTGIADLDRMLSGLDAGSLIVVGARPSMGKTALANTIAMNVARAPPDRNDPPGARKMPGKVVLDFSLEMTKAQLAQRWIAGLTGIETEDQRHGRIRQEDWERLIEAQNYLARLPIFVDDQARLSVAQMRQRARRLKRRIGRLDLIIVDHLQLVRQGGKVENRRLEIGDATAMLKAIAKELGVPVLLLSQLSRAVEQRDDKRPMLSDLRECVTGETPVLMADGRRLPIRELEGLVPRVLAMDGSRRVVSAEAEQVVCVGNRPVVRLRLASGRFLRATGDHRVYCWAGWSRISDLKLGDRVAVARHIPEPESAEEWVPERCALLGHLIGDGSYLTNQPLRYTTGSEENSETVRRAAEDEFGATVSRREGRGNWHQLLISGNGNRWSPRGVNAWLRSLGIWNQRSAEKVVPRDVFRMAHNSLSTFLRHLWATDGTLWAGNKDKRSGPAAVFSTASHTLALDIAHLLLRFDVVARVTRVQNCWCVWVRGVEFLSLFCDAIGSVGPRVEQERRLREALVGRKATTNVDTVPIEIFGQIQEVMSSQGMTAVRLASARGVVRDCVWRSAPSRSLVNEYATVLNDVEIASYANDDVFWDRVVDIVEDGFEEVFDITVPGPNSWISNGVVSHNSGDIEQDADVVMFLYREEYYLARSAPRRKPGQTAEAWIATEADYQDQLAAARGVAEVIIAKNRTGRAGVTVKVAWDASRQRFTDLARP